MPSMNMNVGSMDPGVTQFASFVAPAVELGRREALQIAGLGIADRLLSPADKIHRACEEADKAKKRSEEIGTFLDCLFACPTIKQHMENTNISIAYGGSNDEVRLSLKEALLRAGVTEEGSDRILQTYDALPENDVFQADIVFPDQTAKRCVAIKTVEPIDFLKRQIIPIIDFIVNDFNEVNGLSKHPLHQTISQMQKINSIFGFMMKLNREKPNSEEAKIANGIFFETFRMLMASFQGKNSAQLKNLVPKTMQVKSIKVDAKTGARIA